MTKPLREAINEAVVQWVTSKLKRREPVDVKFMAREMSLSLVELVLELFAHIVGSLSEEYLKRRRVMQTGRRDN